MHRNAQIHLSTEILTCRQRWQKLTRTEKRLTHTLHKIRLAKEQLEQQTHKLIHTHAVS